MSKQQAMTIGKLAHATAVSADTIRYYEQQGLLDPPSRTPANYRVYGPAAIKRLGFIRRAKALGFTLDEVAQLLKLQSTGSRREIKTLASAHLADIEQRIAALESMRSTLAAAVADCDGQGSATGCPIIEALFLEPEQQHDVQGNQPVNRLKE